MATLPTGNRILDSLPGHELQRILEASGPIRDLPFGTHIYEQGRPMREVYFLTSGVGSQVLQLSDGYSTEVGLVGYAELMGIGAWLGDSHSRFDVLMQVAGSAYVIRMPTFADLADDCPQLRRMLRAQSGESIRAVSQLVACNATHPARDRLARWLYSMHVRSGGGEFSMTHELLAIMLGVRRPTLTVVAGELRDAGAIAYRRGRLTVANAGLLKTFECECGPIIDSWYTEGTSIFSVSIDGRSDINLGR